MRYASFVFSRCHLHIIMPKSGNFVVHTTNLIIFRTNWMQKKKSCTLITYVRNSHAESIYIVMKNDNVMQKCRCGSLFSLFLFSCFQLFSFYFRLRAAVRWVRNMHNSSSHQNQTLAFDVREMAEFVLCCICSTMCSWNSQFFFLCPTKMVPKQQHKNVKNKVNIYKFFKAVNNWIVDHIVLNF